MAKYRQGFDTTYKADVDLDDYQWYLVIASSTAGNVEVCATVGASCLGVLQNDPRAGEEAVVRFFGYSKVRANTESGASALDNRGMVQSGSHGMAVGYVNATASLWAVGHGEEDYATGSGAYIEIFVNPGIVRG